jgi:hypothetical protein
LSKPPKIDRKTLKSPDEFVKKGSAGLEFILRHRKVVQIFLGTLIGGAVGYSLFTWWQSSRMEDGWTKFVEAEKAPEAERWDKLKALYTQGRRSRPTLFAAVAVADHFYNEAKKDAANVAPAVTAVEWYGKALEFGDLLPIEKQLLRVNRGNAQELQKKWDDALADYRAASEIAGDAKGLAMLNLARVYELKGDSAKASETYEKVTVDFLNTEYAKQAKNNLRRLKSPLFADQKL